MVNKYYLIPLLLLAIAMPVMGSGIVPLTPDGYTEYVKSPMVPFTNTPQYDSQEMNYGGWNYYETLDYGITAWDIWVESGDTGTFTIHLYNSSNISGSWSMVNTGLLQYQLNFTFSGTAYSENILGLYGSDQLYGQCVMNSTTNETGILFMYYTGGTGADSIFVPVDFMDSPISGLDYSKNNLHQVEVEYYAVDIARMGGGDQVGTIIGYLWQIPSFIAGSFFLIIDILYWFKFIFIDNFLLTISFYILGTLAIATASSKDAFSALKTWWGYQRTAMDFFTWIIEKIINIAYLIKNTIPGLRWL